MEFSGFPVAALDFYDDLELDNTKSFWAAHKPVWEESVRRPMEALVAGLADEFGAAKVFRPYRDVRFAKDKTPYKTHQGAFVAAGPSTGWYVEVGRARRTGECGALPRRRPDTVGVPCRPWPTTAPGRELEKLLRTLERKGWSLGGDQLKTAPRGYDATHPRIGLLRHRSLTASRPYGFEPVIHTAELADRVRRDWRDARGLVEWLRRATE